MKKILSLALCLLLILSIGISVFAISAISVKSIKFDKTSISLSVGKTYNTKVIFTPVNTTQKLLKYSSSNPVVARVDAKGKITALKEGKAVITVISSSNSKVIAKCNINVTQAKLKVCFPQFPIVTDFYDNDMYKHLEEKTGVKIKWEFVPTNDITQKVNLMVASNQLPDVFLNTITTDLVQNFSSMKIFVPINNYFSKSKYLVSWLNKKPFVKELITSPDDGNIYAFPLTFPAGSNIEEVTGSDVPAKMYVYNPWLKALKLDEPKTTDEFTNMLREFKNKDLNGNNKKDEIPLIGANKGGWESFPDNFLINSFIQYDVDFNSNPPVFNPYFVDNSGKIQASYDKNEYREALKYMNKLVSEGLLDPVTYTQDNNQLKQLAEAQTVVVGAFPSGHYSMAVTVGTKRAQDYTPIAPLKGPKGVQLTKTRVFNANLGAAITKKCTNPEAAFLWLDYWYSLDVAMRNKYGIEGIHWAKPASGELDVFDRPAELKVIVDLYSGKQTNVRLGNNFGYASYYMNRQVASQQTILDQAITMKYTPYIPKIENYVLNYTYSKNDAKALSEVNNILRTYVNESRIKFILGVNNINDDGAWKSYLNEIEKIGYKTVINIMQKRKNELRK